MIHEVDSFVVSDDEKKLLLYSTKLCGDNVINDGDSMAVENSYRALANIKDGLNRVLEYDIEQEKFTKVHVVPSVYSQYHHGKYLPLKQVVFQHNDS